MSAPKDQPPLRGTGVRLILFDLDGTLVNTGGAGMRAFDRALGDEFSPDMAIHNVRPAGMTDPAILHEILAARRRSPPTRDEEARFFSRYLEYLEEEVRRSPGFRVLPGVRELLSGLAANGSFLLALGTGNLERGARIKLERAGLNGYFDFGGFGSDSSDRSAALAAAVARAGQGAGGRSPLSRVFVVGDTPHDVAAGRAVGGRVLAVASGPYGRAELLASHPDLLVDDLTDAPRLVEWFLS